MKHKILEVIKKLKIERPIFHSEDDFKFSFSKYMLLHLGNCYDIRLEVPMYIKMIKRNNQVKYSRVPVDILLIDNIDNVLYPIELKYKTKKLDIKYNNEHYRLTNHGANDIGRFSFRKDIFRIEQLISDKSNNIKQGFFIVITNDGGYLENILNKNTLDKYFSYHHKMLLEKEDFGWNYEKLLSLGYVLNGNQELVKNNSLHWTSKGDNFYKLNLMKNYEVLWEEYSRIEKNIFNISILEI